jgi:hypothetical protein
MLKKMHSNEDVVLALLNEGLIMRALDFAWESDAKNLKLSLFLQFIERLKAEGLRTKADFVLRRVMDLKRADEMRRFQYQQSVEGLGGTLAAASYKPMLSDD